jgi:hypothetical protein
MVRNSTSRFLEEQLVLFLFDILEYQFIIENFKIKNGIQIENRFEKNLGCWQGKLLSYGDMLILINSVLTSLPMFMLFF